MKSSLLAATLAMAIALIAVAPLRAAVATDADAVPAGFPPRPKPIKPTTTTLLLKCPGTLSTHSIAARTTTTNPRSNES